MPTFSLSCRVQDHLWAQYLSFCVLFSLALLGGIPRATNWNGLLLWGAWMATQAAQLAVTLISILFELAAFLSLRERLWSCLVTVDGTPLLDFYAWTTFAAQPAIIVKLAIAFAYAFLLCLGLLVLDGSRQWSWHRRRSLPASPLEWEKVTSKPKRGTELKTKALEAQTTFTWDEWAEVSIRRQDKVLEVRSDSFIKVGENYYQPKRDTSEGVETPGTKEGPPAAAAIKETREAAAPPSALRNALCCTAINALPKTKFVESATGAQKYKDKRFRPAIALSVPFFHLARWVLLAVAFSVWPALGRANGAMPGVVAAWAAAAVVAALLPMLRVPLSDGQEVSSAAPGRPIRRPRRPRLGQPHRHADSRARRDGGGGDDGRRHGPRYS